MHVADYPIMPVIDTVTMNTAMWDRKMELRKEDVQELKQRYMARMEQLGVGIIISRKPCRPFGYSFITLYLSTDKLRIED